MKRKIQRKLPWLLLFSVINWVFCPSEAYASRSDQGSNTHSFSVADNQYKYSSYYSDSESGMYYLKARYYSSELMRFISRDTYDLSNRYAYCKGDPISQSDPNGHFPMRWEQENICNYCWDVVNGISSVVSLVGASNIGIATLETAAVFNAVFVLAALGTEVAAKYYHEKDKIGSEELSGTCEKLAYVSFFFDITSTALWVMCAGKFYRQMKLRSETKFEFLIKAGEKEKKTRSWSDFFDNEYTQPIGGVKNSLVNIFDTKKKDQIYDHVNDLGKRSSFISKPNPSASANTIKKTKSCCDLYAASLFDSK